MIEILMWIVTLASVLGTWLNARRNTLCFPIWIATNICWIAYAVHKASSAQAALFFVYSGLAAYGWWNWSRKPQDAAETEPACDSSSLAVTPGP